MVHEWNINRIWNMHQIPTVECFRGFVFVVCNLHQGWIIQKNVTVDHKWFKEQWGYACQMQLWSKRMDETVGTIIQNMEQDLDGAVPGRKTPFVGLTFLSKPVDVFPCAVGLASSNSKDRKYQVASGNPMWQLDTILCKSSCVNGHCISIYDGSLPQGGGCNVVSWFIPSYYLYISSINHTNNGVMFIYEGRRYKPLQELYPP